jgi:restriction system protein
MLVELSSMLPYWVSISLAIISYIVLHSYASSSLQPIIEQGRPPMPDMAGMVFKGAASAFQYLLPMLLVFGAFIKAIKAFQGKRLAERYVTSDRNKTPHSGLKAELKPTDEMNWQQFELLVGQAFRGQGCSVIDGGDTGADGGVDVHIKKDGLKYFVQCKHWQTKKVGVAVVRELYGVIAGAGVEGGFVVCSGGFTNDAKAFAENKQIELIDQYSLNRMLKGVPQPSVEERIEPTVSLSEPLECPKCSSTMIKRKARQGARAGLEFWGCSQYPKCRGIVNV